MHLITIILFCLGRNMINLKPVLYGEVLISGISEKEVYQKVIIENNKNGLQTIIGF